MNPTTLAESVMDYIGLQHIRSYDNIYPRLKEYLENIVKYSKIYLPNTTVKLTFNRPVVTPKESMRDIGDNNYNIEIIIIFAKGECVYRKISLYLPCMLLSKYCLVKGKSALEKNKMGIRENDTGGYYLNTMGMPVVIRMKNVINPYKYTTYNDDIKGVELRKRLMEHYRAKHAYYEAKIIKLNKREHFNGLEDAKYMRDIYEAMSNEKSESKSTFDRCVVNISYIDLFGWNTYVSLFTMHGVLYIEFSLPRRIDAPKNVTSEIYTYMTKGIRYIRGNIIHIVRLLGINVDDLSKYTKYDPLIFDKYLEHTVNAAAEYDPVLLDMYEDDPRDAHIVDDEQLREHFDAYTIPQNYPTTDKEASLMYKTQAIVMLIDKHMTGVMTNKTTDINSYSNKVLVDAGDIAMKYLRQAIDQRLRSEPKRDNPKSILASFNIITNFPSRSYGASTTLEINKAKCPLPNDSHLKNELTKRLIVTLASIHTSSTVRQLKLESQLGNVCVIYTPESENVGLREELAALAAVSLYRSPLKLYTYIDKMRSDIRAENSKAVLIGSLPYGFLTKEQYTRMKSVFNKNLDTHDIVFIEEEDYYQIHHNGGIIGHYSLRIVDGKRPVLTNVPDMIKSGDLYFLTPLEKYRECSSIDLFDSLPHTNENVSEYGKNSYDFCQIVPWGILGYIANLCPNAHKTYLVRAEYNANMIPQGLDLTSIGTQIDMPLLKSIIYPSVPMIISTVGKRVCQKSPYTINVILAIRALPRNNEDGLIISDRCAKLFTYDFFTSLRLRSVFSKDNPVLHAGKMVIVKGMYHGVHRSIVGRKEYRMVNVETGLPSIGAIYKEGDVILARYYVTIRDDIIDCSVKATGYNNGMLVKIIIEGMKLDRTRAEYPISKTTIKMVFKAYRIYTQGDKITLNPSQKGVVARIHSAKDMGIIKTGPFRGAHPYVYASPAIIPTRQTWSIFDEMYASVAAILTGQQQDSNVFNDSKDIPSEAYRIEDETIKKYKDAGISIDATLALSSGVEETTIVSSIGYTLLRHHAADKNKISEAEPNTVGNDIVREVIKGRDGNLRVGVQEILALTAGAAAATLHAINTNHHTRKTVDVCMNCGIIHTFKSGTKCCGENTKLYKLTIRYAFVVLSHIAASIGIQFGIKRRIRQH